MKFESTRTKLFLGDATDITMFQEPFADLTITSPPYNLSIEYETHKDDRPYDEYLDFSRAWISNVYAWSNSNSRFCINVPTATHLNGDYFISGDLVRIAQECGWKFKTDILWNKQNMSSRTAWGSWLSPSAPMIFNPTELILVFYKGDWKRPDTNNKGTDLQRDEFISWTRGVWDVGSESATRVGHPVPFPLEIPHRLIKMFSWIGDVVFDPFTGSGTTLISAHNNNREAVGLEVSEKYFNVAKRRVSQESFTLF